MLCKSVTWSALRVADIEASSRAPSAEDEAGGGACESLPHQGKLLKHLHARISVASPADAGKSNRRGEGRRDGEEIVVGSHCSWWKW